MSWKTYDEPHDHVDGPYDDESEPVDFSGCLSLTCNNCNVEHEIESGIVGHWEPDDRGSAIGIAREDDWYGWYVDETGDVAYCHECRAKVGHACSYAGTDDPCDICQGWPEDVAS